MPDIATVPVPAVIVARAGDAGAREAAPAPAPVFAIRPHPVGGAGAVDAAARLAGTLRALGFGVAGGEDEGGVRLCVGGDGSAPALGEVQVPADTPDAMLEAALRAAPVRFDDLPLLVEGDSKIVRLWTDRVVAVRFKPTVYSYTMNRYGEAPGTDAVRVRFTSAVFRAMARAGARGGIELRSAFLAERQDADGPLLIERRVESCNVETRIKRFHIGSPLHRYHYTEEHPSTQRCGPVGRWSRFDVPVVAFDWRNPLRDGEGRRLADEPISDDYAAVWMRNVSHAKELARELFLWLEERFAEADLRLVDMCLFIDADGRQIYGEISPDCMRVRVGFGPPGDAEPADKDLWRRGSSSGELRDRYEELYRRFASTL